MKIQYARYGTDIAGYECSSKGDKRFSAFGAKLKDGRSIEEAYQLDIKGYRAHGNSWRLGKGKKPLISRTHEETWALYKGLWKQYMDENPMLYDELMQHACDNGCLLTDMFAKTVVSQARALTEILNERYPS